MKKILVPLFSILIACSFACKKKNAIEAQINAYSGSVTVNGTAVTGNSIAIAYGDRVETGDTSFCTIIVENKNIFRLGANSSLVFNISQENNILLLEKGWFSGVTRKAFSRQARYLIKSPTVTASIRGTSYCVKVEDTASTYFCVCNGTIDLADALTGNGETVSASHHAARRFTSDGKGNITVNRNPGMLYHDDAGVESLAGIINEKIDWTAPDEH
jgi:hypothetical protein